MLRYNTKTRPGLVALYDIRPGNGAGPFLQPPSLHGMSHHLGLWLGLGFDLAFRFLVSSRLIYFLCSNLTF